MNNLRYAYCTLLKQQIRTYTSKPVRVRFAPSPTGYLHLGGLRTALYNYLYAISHNGKMILRIEDTDQTRTVPGALETLIQNLDWVGINCHEGPTQGGDYGPYIQSKRCDIYQKHVQTLIENGSAYKCFCTDRRLNILRRESLRTNQIPKYDNRCRHLTKDEIKEKLDKGKKYCIRFKLSTDCSSFEDLIYGSIAYEVTLNEGDPVILKSDGFPTYHLANVVDDHLMNISHVLRGVEWQISTTKHLLLYRAFSWKPPQFGHLPLIMNSDGTKLSKRQGDIRIEEYKKNGILPSALINYITLAGGGFSRIRGEGLQYNNMEELSNMFKLDLINCNSSHLNPELLTECNRLAIVEMIKDDDNVINEVQNLINTHFKDKKLESHPDYIRAVLKWSSGRINKLQDLVSPALSFLWVLPDHKSSLDPTNLEMLKCLYDKLSAESDINFETKHMKNYLKEFCKDNNIAFSNFMKLIRTLLSGLNDGPGVAEMMEVLGKTTTLERLNIVINGKY